MFWSQPRDKFVFEFADFLRVQVAHFLGHVDKRREDFIMALLGTLLKGAPSSTDLNRELLTAGVPNELARLLLHVLGGAGGLVDRPALLRALPLAHFGHRPVALPHCLVVRLLFERDLARLLEVLVAHLLLAGLELGDIGVVTLLGVLVSTLQDGILLQGGDLGDLVDTAEAGVGVGDAATEVHPARHSTGLLASLPTSPGGPGGRGAEEVSGGCSQDGEKTQEHLGRNMRIDLTPTTSPTFIVR